MTRWHAVPTFTEVGHLNQLMEQLFCRALHITRRVVQGEFGQPLTYLTYILSNARNRVVPLPAAYEFAHLSSALADRCAL